MINLNNTEARQNVEPLTAKDLNNAVILMNQFLKYGFDANRNEIGNWQRMVDSYQNLQHFWDVVGGWEGLNNKVQQSFLDGIETVKNDENE